MSIPRSHKISPSALHRTALTRMPVAVQGNILSFGLITRQPSASSRSGTPSLAVALLAFTTAINSTELTRSFQIPIAHRHR